MLELDGPETWGHGVLGLCCAVEYFSRAGVSRPRNLGPWSFGPVQFSLSAVSFFDFSRFRRGDFRYTKIWERERDDFQDFMAPGLLCEQKKRSSKCIWIEDSPEKSKMDGWMDGWMVAWMDG